MPSRKGSPNKRPAKTRIMLRLGEDTLSRIAAHQAANQLLNRTSAVEDLAKRGDK